jgi:hypothetical protein
MSDVEKPPGLIHKFHVERLVPSSRGIDHSECQYFVLDPEHDPLARQLLSEYAMLADQIGEKKLAADMFQWLADLSGKEANRNGGTQSDS